MFFINKFKKNLAKGNDETQRYSNSNSLFSGLMKSDLQRFRYWAEGLARKRVGGFVVGPGLFKKCY
jgi:hypothetical protein